ncbi:MAG: hypothetical protein IPQ07_20335 [Myxococcales bacterium]|nr:hypothetical protein [Myxococcales bacterium]
MPPRRLRRSSAVDLHGLVEPPSWWSSLMRWFVRPAVEPPLDHCGRWPAASRVIDPVLNAVKGRGTTRS